MPLILCWLRPYRANQDTSVSNAAGEIQVTPMVLIEGICPALQLRSTSPPLLVREVQQPQAGLLLLQVILQSDPVTLLRLMKHRLEISHQLSVDTNQGAIFRQEHTLTINGR